MKQNPPAWQIWQLGVTVGLLVVLFAPPAFSQAPPRRRDDLVISFANAGLWTVIDGTFRQLHTVTPHLIAAGDLDGDGIDDLGVDFGTSYEHWYFRNNLYWEGRGFVGLHVQCLLLCPTGASTRTDTTYSQSARI